MSPSSRARVDRAPTPPTGDELVYTLAGQIAFDCAELDQRCQADAIRRWVRANVRYTPDPGFRDSYAHAYQTIRARRGDCDDLTILGLALALSLGIPCDIVTGSAYSDEPTHVIGAVELGGQLVPMELSGDMPLGKLPEGFQVMQIVRVEPRR